MITDQTGYFQSVLEARAFDNIYRHFGNLSEHSLQPDAWSILANLIYWAVLLLIALAKGLSLAVVAFGLNEDRPQQAAHGAHGQVIPLGRIPQSRWPVSPVEPARAKGRSRLSSVTRG